MNDFQIDFYGSFSTENLFICWNFGIVQQAKRNEQSELIPTSPGAYSKQTSNYLRWKTFYWNNTIQYNNT